MTRAPVSLMINSRRHDIEVEARRTLADDIRDVVSDPALLGKPVGQDLLLDRPSAARELGLDGAVIHFDRLIAQAIDSIPVCPSSRL